MGNRPHAVITPDQAGLNQEAGFVVFIQGTQAAVIRLHVAAVRAEASPLDLHLVDVSLTPLVCNFAAKCMGFADGDRVMV